MLSLTMQAQKIYSKNGSISFFSKTSMENISASSNQALCVLDQSAGNLQFSVLIKSFVFKKALMQEHFNENYMESTQFPKADFKGYIINIKEINFSKDGAYPIQVEGVLTIHGVSQKTNTKGTLTLAQGKATIEGDFSVKVKDYGITGLYIGEKIANEATIKLNCKY